MTASLGNTYGMGGGGGGGGWGGGWEGLVPRPSIPQLRMDYITATWKRVWRGA